MDTQKKVELLKALDPKIKNTPIESAFLSTYEDDFIPMWERATKPLEQVAQERAELLSKERRKVRKLEAKVSSEYSYG
jgi:hypothetical protein